MIAIVDYGSGNIQAIKNIYKKLKVDCIFASKPEHLDGIDKIILPGVGAFDEAIQQLTNSGMKDILTQKVIQESTPVLGVCVGMQIMAKSSDEGNLEGLGWFDAEVKKFDESTINFKPKLPHMGWNELVPNKSHPILNNIDMDKGFYFLHSFYFQCNDENDILAKAHYGSNFHCAVQKNNVFGFQFHPEKSHTNGINLFQNFAEL